MDLAFLLFVLALFIAVVLLLEGAYVFWESKKGPEAKRLQQRLRLLEGGKVQSESISLLKSRVLSDLPLFDRVLHSLPRVSSLDRWVLQSGVATSVGRLLSLTLLAGVATFLVALLLNVPPIVAVLFFALPACSIPWVVVARCRAKRLHKFEEQLPDALDLIGRALRAGHAFPIAMQMVATEATDPIASEFQAAFDEINFGVPMSEAMMSMAARVPSMDLRYFVVSVLLQRETGGNLAELLDNLSTLVRERFKLMGRVRVLAAEGKLSAYILVALPFFTAGAIFTVAPKFMEVLWTDPMGLNMVFGTIAMMIVGVFVMWRIVKIRV